jgi:hypothetical protein
MFLLNSWSPPVCYSSRVNAFTQVSTNLQAAEKTETCKLTTSRPFSRANPYPEVTDRFCRVPLKTFFYRLEVINLGDLLRFVVRAAVGLTLKIHVSKQVD